MQNTRTKIWNLCLIVLLPPVKNYKPRNFLSNVERTAKRNINEIDALLVR